MICDRVAILQRGEVIREGLIQDLTRQQGYFLVGLAKGQALPLEDLAQAGFHARPYGERWEVVLNDGQSIDAVVDFLRARGLSVRHLVEKKQSLEELFLETVEAAEPGVDGRSRPAREGRGHEAQRDAIRKGVAS